jgi:hypothetical protein
MDVVYLLYALYVEFLGGVDSELHLIAALRALISVDLRCR